MIVVTVDMLSGLSMEEGVSGVVELVHRLLLRVLFPVEELSDELLAPELSFLNLLNAPMLEIGGLDASTVGEDSWDSGAA